MAGVATPVFAAHLLSAVIGGALIGLSAVMTLGLSGRVAGVSGAVIGLISQRVRATSETPAMFVAGLLLAPWLLAAGRGTSPTAPETGSLPSMALAGLMVGAGALLANGCTSGHGVCGLARLSRRSIVAVAVFMASAVLTVALRRALGGLA